MYECHSNQLPPIYPTTPANAGSVGGMQPLIDAYTVSGNPEEHQKFEKQQKEFEKTREEFVTQYQEKTQEILDSWFDNNLDTDSYRGRKPRVVFDENNHMRIIVQSPIYMAAGSNYFPAIITEVESDVVLSSLIGEVIGLEKAENIITDSNKPFRMFRLRECNNIHMYKAPTITLDQLTKVNQEINSESASRFIAPKLEEIGENLSLDMAALIQTGSLRYVGGSIYIPEIVTQRQFIDAFPNLETVGDGDLYDHDFLVGSLEVKQYLEKIRTRTVQKGKICFAGHIAVLPVS